jgi:N-acetylneuraminic acid mutarotase
MFRKLINSSSSDDREKLPDIQMSPREEKLKSLEELLISTKFDLDKLQRKYEKVEGNESRIFELEERFKKLETAFDEANESNESKKLTFEAKLAYLGLKTKIQQKLIFNLQQENEYRRTDIQILPILEEKQWQLLPYFNIPISCGTCHIVDSKLILIGGKDKSANEVRIYNFESKTWEYTKITDFPRFKHTSVFINDFIYIYGGKNDENKTCGNCLKLNLKNWKLSEITIQKFHPNPLHSHTAIVKDKKMIIFGGVMIISSSYFKTKEEKSTNQILEFCSEKSEWNIVDAVGDTPKPIKNHSAVFSSEHDLMVIFGGQVWNDKNSDYICSNTVYEFNFRTFSWKKPNTIGFEPSPRFGHSSFISGDVMFIIGGNEMGKTMKNDLFQFDIENNFWNEIKLPMSPSPRQFCCSTYYNEFFYWIGGSEHEKTVSDGYSFHAVVNEQEVDIPNVKESKKIIALRQESKKLKEDLKNMEEVYMSTLK